MPSGDGGRGGVIRGRAAGAHGRTRTPRTARTTRTHTGARENSRQQPALRFPSLKIIHRNAFEESIIFDNTVTRPC